MKTLEDIQCVAITAYKLDFEGDYCILCVHDIPT